MVNEEKARLLKNSQGRYLIYLSVDFAEDNMFPLKVAGSMYMQVGFKQGERRIPIDCRKEKENSSFSEIMFPFCNITATPAPYPPTG